MMSRRIGDEYVEMCLVYPQTFKLHQTPSDEFGSNSAPLVRRIDRQVLQITASAIMTDVNKLLGLS